jgi:tRNA(Ile)-lysidine synthetase-like protein
MDLTCSDNITKFEGLTELVELFIELFNFWFSDETKKYWFDSTPEFDMQITDKYNTLLEHFTFDKIKKYDLIQICEDYRSSIGLIILHDQIPRHIYRDNKEKINYYLSLIIDFSEKIYIKYKYDLNPSHYCFVLLPFRHLNKFDKMMYVLSETKIRIKNYPLEHEYKRFFKATLERYIKFNQDISNIKIIEPTNEIPIIIQDDMQICEYGLRRYYPVNFKDINMSDLPEYIKNMYDIIKKNIHVKKAIISLSGGVDSMVLSYILKHIGIDIIAVHINYNNRPECEFECNILRDWCSFLGIKLYIRKIVEIQRQEMMELNMRDLYESYTRDIRFNTYVYSNLDNEIPCDLYCNIYDDCNVFLGHNHDDQFENIFTNIVSQSHYHNLRGMKINTQIEFKTFNINFLRPMLEITKDNIYKFASYFSIPHFKDSTPKWSQRGKIRDIIRPSIEQWDSRAISSFFNLSDKLSDLISISKFSVSMICDNIKQTNKLEINLDELYPKTMFEMIFNQMEIKISQKSLNVFYEKLLYIKKNKKKYKINIIEKYRLNKEIIISWKNLEDNKIMLKFC